MPLISLDVFVFLVDLKELEVLVDLLRVEFEFDADLLELLKLEGNGDEVLD